MKEIHGYSPHQYQYLIICGMDAIALTRVDTFIHFFHEGMMVFVMVKTLNACISELAEAELRELCSNPSI